MYKRQTLNIVNGTYTDDINNEKEQNGTKNSALIRNLGTMTIHDGTFTDSGIVIKNDDSSAQVYGNLTIKGGTYHCTSDKSFANIQNSGVATIEEMCIRDRFRRGHPYFTHFCI